MRQIQDAKILLVDDNRELLELLRETLSGAGYRSLATAETCAEARAAFALWTGVPMPAESAYAAVRRALAERG